MIAPQEQFHELPDGRRIRILVWPVEGATRSVQVIHGMSEHVGRYHHLADALNRAGYAVFGHDHLGHGRSDGARGVLPAFSTLLDDVGTVRALAPRLTGVNDDPLWVGHSMGGLVLIRYLQERGSGAPGAVISAPWLGTRVSVPPIKRGLAHVLRWVAPNLAIDNAFDPTALTRDPVEQERYREDPLVHHRISAGLYFRMRAEQQAALGQGLPKGIPALVVLPGADSVTDVPLATAWARAAGPDVTLVELPGVPHEPFNDLERNEILDKIVEWMNALGGL